MPFPQPTEKLQPHAFEKSGFVEREDRGGQVLCAVCGMREANSIHGPQFEESDHVPLTREGYLIQVVELTALRSTCNRGQVGAIIVAEGRIISSGYNGAPPGMPHCTDVGCAPVTGCERTVHAEANAVAWAARNGITVQGAGMICTHGPCVNCAKLLVSAGIHGFTYLRDYHSQRLDILEAGKVNVYKV